MSKDQKPKKQHITLNSLEQKLRQLPQAQAPQALESRLLKAIGGQSSKVTWKLRAKYYFQAWDYGKVAAAAILIFALMTMINYGFPAPSQASLTEFNDTLLCYAQLDQNSFLYDQNNACLEKTLLCELK